ncbi:hypothetical protein [Neisseria sp.]|uniref:hypothetical protein n=1 Tax=Neisseria sp. TaxID=192066 RepID=UPI0026DB6EFF|nr:hypothetical protein [Neisseria sp.]MDO4226208.1 hypothetical protein [Neisseria sp.]
MEEDKSTGRPGSRRMEVLQQSLAKKQAAFDQSLQAHIDDVRSANGQPLNDKRTGRQTLDRWERQNDSLRTRQEDIQKTQRAIEREQHKIDHVARTPIPEFLKPMLESGEISQWRKYPNRFFVKGVDKARIIWFEDKQEFGYSHIQGMPPEQRPLFKAAYDKIRAMHSRVRGSSPEPAVAVTEERNTVPGTGVSAGSSVLSENPPAPTAGDSGFPPGTVLRHQNRHIRDVYLVVGVSKEDGRYLLLGDEPVSTPVLRESTAGELEPAGHRAFQTSLVYENADADKAYRLFEKNAARYESRYELISKPAFFISFGRTEPGMDMPPAGQAAADKHYSEKIIDHLAEQHSWQKEDARTASAILNGVVEGGSLNPEGRLKVFARFDETGRYLSLERGWDTLFDMDARDIHATAAAALIHDSAQRLRYTDKPIDRDEIGMRLYGSNLYHLARQSPDAAAETREILPAPHLCTPEKFAGTARAVPSDTDRRWKVRWPEVTAYGMSYAFSDSTSAAEAVRDAHRTVVNAHLSRITDGGIRPPGKEELPPPEVLAHYPDLAKRYLPPAQTPSDKLAAAKDSYMKQTLILPPPQQERRRLLESQMETLIKGLPEQTQMQARINFYTSQVEERLRQVQKPEPPGQNEISFDR